MSEYQRKIWVCLPAMNEADQLPSFLQCLLDQTYTNFELHICVNQPDTYQESHPNIFENNQKSIALLEDYKEFKIEIIDRASSGQGWNTKHYGVGWARKSCMDSAADQADLEDLIICVDADTFYPANYFQSLIDNFKHYQKQLGLSIPYFHPLTLEDSLNQHILRYEIYMRTYAINMWAIENPYAYTAVGSSMACTVKTYRKIGGMTPHKSGEDFYFLQKIRKAGILGVWNEVHTQPAARYSDRVFFGTGPALIKGSQGDWSSYPIYYRDHFLDIQKTFACFEELFQNPNKDYPLKPFLQETFSCLDPFDKLRQNAKTTTTFVKACTQKVDGLRILQYLKTQRAQIQLSDTEILLQFFEFHFPGQLDLDQNFSIETASTKTLSNIRDFLLEEEHKTLKKYQHEHA